jgi:hypothetical protein
MKTLKPKNIYPCTQAELYAIAGIALDSFQQNLVDFSNFKTIYSPVFLADRMVELAAAVALPDLQQRDEPVELARKELEEKS